MDITVIITDTFLFLSWSTGTCDLRPVPASKSNPLLRLPSKCLLLPKGTLILGPFRADVV